MAPRRVATAVEVMPMPLSHAILPVDVTQYVVDSILKYAHWYVSFILVSVALSYSVAVTEVIVTAWLICVFATPVTVVPVVVVVPLPAAAATVRATLALSA